MPMPQPARFGVGTSVPGAGFEVPKGAGLPIVGGPEAGGQDYFSSGSSQAFW